MEETFLRYAIKEEKFSWIKWIFFNLKNILLQIREDLFEPIKFFNSIKNGILDSKKMILNWWNPFLQIEEDLFDSNKFFG